MKKQTSNRSGLLLMEIIIAILFFSVISAICLQLFVKSHTFSRNSEELDSAVNQVSSAAELIRSTEMERPDDIPAVFKDYYPDLKADGDVTHIYYDKDFKPCRKSDAAYSMEISLTSAENRVYSYNLSMSKAGSSACIYELDITTYQQLTR